MAFDIHTLDPNKVTASKIIGPGVQFKESKIIELRNIWVSSKDNNHARVEMSEHQVQNCVTWFSEGILYDRPPPIVRYNPRMIDGGSYEYELIAGHHRFEAFLSLKYDRWIFWVYDICLDGYSFDDSKITLQLLEQDGHKPGLSSSIDDATNAISWLVTHGSKLVENTEDSIRNYVNQYCSSMSKAKKGSVVSRVMAKVGTYRRILTYTAKDAKEWIQKNTDYPIKDGGDYDSKRKKHVWSLLEDYEYEQLFNAMRKYHETGKESYFICRTKSPMGVLDLHAKREGMHEEINYLNDCLLETFKYYQENEKFPWDVECFIPQDTEIEDKDQPVFLK